MSRWFRFYDEVLNDPKVQLLPPEKFKIWVNLLCLASKNDGVLPALDAVTFALRVTRDDLVTTLDQFRDAGLLDLVEVRDAPMSYEPHNWKERQYISDTKDPTGAERARRYRERHGRVTRDGRDANVSVTATRTDTECKLRGKFKLRTERYLASLGQRLAEGFSRALLENLPSKSGKSAGKPQARNDP